MDSGTSPLMTQIINPTGGAPFKLLSIEKSGEVVLWIGFFIFVLSTLLIAFLASRLQVKHRALHYITLVVTGVASLSHLSMATGTGFWFVFTGFYESGNGELMLRLESWARYADWAITVPLVLLDLSLLAGLPWVDVFLLVLAGEAAVVCAAFSALFTGPLGYLRWGWFALTLIFLGLVCLTLVLKGWKCAKHQHAAVTRLYTTLMFYTVFIWTLYPVVIALSNITGIIDPNTEVIAETILDILSKVVFGIILVFHKHDSYDVGPAKFSEAWLEIRGTRGEVYLPETDN